MMINLIHTGIIYFLANSIFFSCSDTDTQKPSGTEPVSSVSVFDSIVPLLQTDTALYNLRMDRLANGDQSGPMAA